jgi:exonuclease SbcD
VRNGGTNVTRVIHTGDTHLGYQQYHRPERREDFLDAFRQVAADAVDDDVDAVVHAGDLFHDRRPTLVDIMGALEVLRTLDDADVPFLAIVGNHEAKRDAQWLDLFERLGLATRLGPEPVEVGDVAVYGLDFVPRAKRERLAYDFADHDAEYAALVSHGLFEPFDFGDWDAAHVLAESSVDVDAMLLGDNHAPGKKRVDGAWVTYCGSTERASADERNDRGYNIVRFGDVEGDAAVDIRRRGLDTREFVFVDVELGPGEGIDRVRERVSQEALEEAVVIVSITGDGEPLTPAAVEEAADEQGALVARVTDHREIADDADVEVSFADPDDAVRERLRDLGLSEAARSLDETIRASDVPDSRVDDVVEERVRDLANEGDPSQFQDVAEFESDEGDDESDESTAEGDDVESERDEGDADASDDPTDDGEGETDAGDDQVTMEDYL